MPGLMSYWHFQTATGQPVAVAAAARGYSSHFDRQQRPSRQRQLAVSDDAEVTGYVLDSETRRQNVHMGHMGDVKLGELLTRTQPHDLGFGWVQSEPTGSQPGLDIG